MAITTTIKTNPAYVSFAGNPIVFKVETSKGLDSEESFLRILCTATFSLSGDAGFYTGNKSFTVELSQPVEDYGTATFNLSDAAQTLIRNAQSSIEMNSSSNLDNYGVTANVVFHTAWVKDNVEIVDGEEHAPMLYIVPGAFTDYEQLVRDDTYLLSVAKNGKELTRKPGGGILYKGEMLIVPTLYAYYLESSPGTLSYKTMTFTMTVGGKQVSSGSSFIDCNVVDYQTATTTLAEADGEFVFNSGSTGPITGYYRTNTTGVHFLRFINGFGAVENISVRAKDKLTYEVSGETHSLVQEATTRPTDRRYATKSQPVGVYELSSGYVPRAWAEWYVQELLTSPRVWIQLGGKWVPALIEAEDDCVIYDRSKPEMPHVDFTLRLAIDGVTGCTW